MNEVCIDRSKLKKCIGGLLLFGKCFCQRGFKLIGDSYCKLVNNQCIGGRKVNSVCICPSGKRQKNGRCVNTKINPHAIESCPPGTRRDGIFCIPKIRPSQKKDEKEDFASKNEA